MNTAESLQDQWLDGWRFLKAHDYKQALYKFKAIIDQDPNCALALAGVANVYCEIYQPRKAWEYAQKAVDLLPHDIFILNVALQCALCLSKIDDAKRYAEKAYKLAPKSADGINAYLLYLQHTGDVSKIERLVRELLTINKSAPTKLIAGMALEVTGKIPEVIRIYRQAIADVLALSEF